MKKSPPWGARRRGRTGSILPYRVPGRRPRRPAPPRRHPPPPLVHPCTGKNEGPPGGCTDGPSIRLPSRRGSPYPRVVLLSVCFLPASLPTAEVGDHDQDHRESRHFTSPPSTRFGLVDLVRDELLQTFLVLPAGLAAAEARDHHENHRESRHHSPLGLGFAASLASASRSRLVPRAAAMPFATRFVIRSVTVCNT